MVQVTVLDWVVVCFLVVCLRVVLPVGIRPAEPPCHLALFAARLVVVLLPLLPLTLPWLAYASRALYRQVLPKA